MALRRSDVMCTMQRDVAFAPKRGSCCQRAATAILSGEIRRLDLRSERLDLLYSGIGTIDLYQSQIDCLAQRNPDIRYSDQARVDEMKGNTEIVCDGRKRQVEVMNYAALAEDFSHSRTAVRMVRRRSSTAKPAP